MPVTVEIAITIRGTKSSLFNPEVCKYESVLLFCTFLALFSLFMIYSKNIHLLKINS